MKNGIEVACDAVGSDPSLPDGYDCSKVTIGFTRNFETDNAEQDIQFKTSDYNIDYPVFGAIVYPNIAGDGLVEFDNTSEDDIQTIRVVSKFKVEKVNGVPGTVTDVVET